MITQAWSKYLMRREPLQLVEDSDIGHRHLGNKSAGGTQPWQPAKECEGWEKKIGLVKYLHLSNLGGKYYRHTSFVKINTLKYFYLFNFKTSIRCIQCKALYVNLKYDSIKIKFPFKEMIHFYPISWLQYHLTLLQGLISNWPISIFHRPSFLHGLTSLLILNVILNTVINSSYLLSTP